MKSDPAKATDQTNPSPASGQFYCADAKRTDFDCSAQCAKCRQLQLIAQS